MSRQYTVSTRLNKLNFIATLSARTVRVHVSHDIHLSVHIHRTATQMYLAITPVS